jgi:hypothetical protein
MDVMLNGRSASGWAAAAGLALTMVVIGCEHAETRTPVAGTAPVEGVTNQQNAAAERVVERLAYARCDHEQACKNIGNGRKYVTSEVCMDQVRGNTANDLNAYNCPRGIDQKALDTCLEALRSSGCNFSLDALNRDNNCRSGAMCMK